LGKAERIASIIDAIISPCKLPPDRDEPILVSSRPDNRLTRRQGAALGVMTLTMTGILVINQWAWIPPHVPPDSPWKYATDVLIMKINDAGNPIWTLPIRFANTTSKLDISHNSVDIVECRGGGYAVASPIMSMKDDTDSLGIMLTRISDTGVVLWKYTFDNISIEMGLSLIETRNEGYAMA